MQRNFCTASLLKNLNEDVFIVIAYYRRSTGLGVLYYFWSVKMKNLSEKNIYEDLEAICKQIAVSVFGCGYLYLWSVESGDDF